MSSEAARFLQVVARAMPGECTTARAQGMNAMAGYVALEFPVGALTTALARKVGERLGQNFPTTTELCDAIRHCRTGVAVDADAERDEATVQADVFEALMRGTGKCGSKTLGFRDHDAAVSMAIASLQPEALAIIRQRHPKLFPRKEGAMSDTEDRDWWLARISALRAHPQPAVALQQALGMMNTLTGPKAAPRPAVIGVLRALITDLRDDGVKAAQKPRELASLRSGRQHA